MGADCLVQSILCIAETQQEVSERKDKKREK